VIKDAARAMYTVSTVCTVNICRSGFRGDNRETNWRNHVGETLLILRLESNRVLVVERVGSASYVCECTYEGTRAPV